MAKIKIVQIALTSVVDGMGGADQYAEYLDDKGRVWYQLYNRADGHYDWKQLELPDEPQVSDMPF